MRTNFNGNLSTGSYILRSAYPPADMGKDEGLISAFGRVAGVSPSATGRRRFVRQEVGRAVADCSTFGQIDVPVAAERLLPLHSQLERRTLPRSTLAGPLMTPGRSVIEVVLVSGDAAAVVPVIRNSPEWA
jgi:hypothetical protein